MCAIGLQKKILGIVFAIVLLIQASICVASYLVRLTNGNHLVVHEYWEDGSQVRFYSNGGLVGVQKRLVRKIEEADFACIIERPEPPLRWTDQQETKHKSASEYENKAPLPDLGDKALLEEKRLVMMRIRAVSAAFKEAKAQNNRMQMQEERNKLLTSQTEFSRLLKKVKNVHGGQVPTWWDDPVPAD